MRICLIVAMSRNRAIGRDNALPWHLPEDLRRFRQLTLGKPVVMGRRTFESIGRPLPGRANIVISASPGFVAPQGVYRVQDLPGAIALARGIAERDGAGEIMVIGGAAVYRQAMECADRIYLTLIDEEIEGDTFFPELDCKQWVVSERERVAGAGYTRPDFAFLVLDRLRRK
jgi:dihydrofolate reductase